MAINIPDRFINKLNNTVEMDNTYLNKIERCITTLQQTFTNNRPDFFTEYTDHGELHINHVLIIADKLITDKSFENMSEYTLAITVMGILFHDISMYINYDAFNELITGDYKIDNFDTKSIKTLWEEYCKEINNASDSELNKIFGTDKIDFQQLPEDNGKLTDYDKMVIGEFIRRNHHKISQYIILGKLNIYGKDSGNNQHITEDQLSIDNKDPDKTKTLISEEDFNNNELKLIGMIARSHGEDIRSLESFYKSSTPNNCDIFYSMAILSLADLLDTGRERALQIIKSLKISHSDISLREYEWNGCIYFRNYEWNTPSRKLVINADKIENVTQFAKIKSWLEYTQLMLDKCIAIICEKYGYDKYDFSIFRVDSNILSKEYKDELSQSFYPEEVRFEANPDITKLLIAPLYGDDPTFGVRELVQNAVDACRERKALGNDENYFGNVEVIVNTKKKEFTITDDGIGMTAETIKNYFLKAGASLRNSDYWKKHFIDENGKSEVCRNGQFGIGVLATFLIGDKATVTTRNINDEKGWKFTFERNQGNIELKRVKAKVGTTITIPLTDTVINKFNDNNKIKNFMHHGEQYATFWYDWYVWEEGEPVVKYWFDNIEKFAEIPDVYWHKVQQNDFEELYWNYDIISAYSIYNGIKIFNNLNNIICFQYSLNNLHIKCREKLSRNNHLNLNIERTKINSLSCKKALIEDFAKWYITPILSENATVKLKNNINIPNNALLSEYMINARSHSYIIFSVDNHFYSPFYDESKEIAFKVIGKYFPKDTILKYGFPNDIKERVKIYENAYKELFRYLEEDIINGYRDYDFTYYEIQDAMRELNLLPTSDQSSDT